MARWACLAEQEELVEGLEEARRGLVDGGDDGPTALRQLAQNLQHMHCRRRVQPWPRHKTLTISMTMLCHLFLTRCATLPPRRTGLPLTQLKTNETTLHHHSCMVRQIMLWNPSSSNTC